MKTEIINLKKEENKEQDAGQQKMYNRITIHNFYNRIKIHNFVMPI